MVWSLKRRQYDILSLTVDSSFERFLTRLQISQERLCVVVYCHNLALHLLAFCCDKSFIPLSHVTADIPLSFISLRFSGISILFSSTFAVVNYGNGHTLVVNLWIGYVFVKCFNL